MNDKPQIGIALGGGVVRGFAHLGVLQVLEQAEVPIDFVGGSSVGALIGYCYAAGMSLEQITHTAEQLNWWQIASPHWSRWGVLSFDKLERRLLTLLGDLHFEDLARPFVVMTADLETGRPYPITQGRITPAVCASCSVPGLFAPVHLDGRLLIDGGIANNVPAAAVRGLGADWVIGVDIFQHTPLRPFLGPLAVSWASFEILLARSGNGLEEADCLITPALRGLPYGNFAQRDEFVQRGRAAAQAALPQLQEALAARH